MTGPAPQRDSIKSDGDLPVSTAQVWTNDQSSSFVVPNNPLAASSDAASSGVLFAARTWRR
jgi:hypothetical protein